MIHTEKYLRDNSDDFMLNVTDFEYQHFQGNYGIGNGLYTCFVAKPNMHTVKFLLTHAAGHRMVIIHYASGGEYNTTFTSGEEFSFHSEGAISSVVLITESQPYMDFDYIRFYE